MYADGSDGILSRSADNTPKNELGYLGGWVGFFGEEKDALHY